MLLKNSTERLYKAYDRSVYKPFAGVQTKTDIVQGM